VDRNDTFDGGLGKDTLSYEGIGVGMTIDMAHGVATSSETGTDGFSNFEIVIGGEAADSITGSAADDTIRGGGGADTIKAGAGNDLIVGGSGADVLIGGTGANTFRYEAVSDSTGGSIDKIEGLTSADHIDLSAIDADVATAGDQAFNRVDAFSHAAGELTVSYSHATGLTTVSGDVDGDGVADLVIHITGDQTGFTGFIY
jgi:Ca2+-binding RTX toxin-like protein